ncbi:uncharacterized protein LOC112045507 [Bicyclus anynana]|uniref:Uncharacterized protein LOC112045507 n=1 Tax=Bicyclus anynana TaxID=110368 RepID=A0A6J1MPG8_BICAN|nr:uncharacterized protein LOC112045507 [Bicyclus anynana]
MDTIATCNFARNSKSNLLGSTGIPVAPISLGGAAFSDIYGEFDETRSVCFIRDCLFRGINYIDTSPWYGQGTSETIIGKALDGMHRPVFVIGSKVGRYEKDVRRMFDFSRERTLASVDQSLDRLKLSYLDIIQIHDVSFADIDMILNETLPALQAVVDAGKARYIGIADYDLDLMKAIVEESRVPIATVLSYAKSTLIDNRLQDYVSYFKSRGVGIINAAPTGMGLLTNAGPRDWHPASQEVKTLCQEAAMICQAKKVELANIANWFSLRQPNIDTTVCGLANLDHQVGAFRVYRRGLTHAEEMVMKDLQKRYFDRGIMNWDGVEVNAYRAAMAQFAEEPQNPE